MPSGASRTACRESLFWIYGAAGSGKSHLLQATCAQAGVAGNATVFFPLDVVRGRWTCHPRRI